MIYISSILIVLLLTVTSCQQTDTQLTKGETKLTYQKSSVGDDDDPYARLEQELMMLRDPATNRIPLNIFKREQEFAEFLPKRIKGILYKDNQGNETQALTWTARGPNNVGGRTRALGIDVRTTVPPNVTIIAGGISGGLWRSPDDGVTWSLQTLPSQLHSVTCLAQDIRSGEEDNWYAGSGETSGNSANASFSASFRGDGIFKSTDNGLTWTQLPSTVSGTPDTSDVFDFVHNIAVSQITGTVFAATSNTIQRSTDGGTSWSIVRGTFSNSSFTDVQITSTGVVYATLNSTATNPGIWRSIDDGVIWTNITPGGFPATFNRIVISITPNTSIDCDIWFLGETPGGGRLGHSLWNYNSIAGSWINRSANIPDSTATTPYFKNPVGRFNSQGAYDLVIKTKNLSLGDAIFTTSDTITTGADFACSVYAEDVDGDGDIDLLSASESDGKIAWYENNGSQNFTPHTISTNAEGAHSVYAIDVDSDGHMDVLSASEYKISWYENDGNENFIPHTITTDTYAYGNMSVYAVDVDGDGDIDVLSASYYDDQIAWYENDGNESFTPHTITTNASGAYSVYALDVDGDGDIDVLSAAYYDDEIAWYENDGNESFTPHTITTDDGEATSVYAVDVDSDGDIDVLSASEYDGKIAWYENNGNENFTPHTIITGTYHARSVYAADVNGDGNMDVLSASDYDDEINWYENDGTFPPDFITHTITSNANGAQSVYAVDVDCDGDIDVLSASAYDDEITWYENTSIITNFVFVGGTNLYRSTDGFATSGATTWIGGYSPANDVSQYPNHHPDQHALSFIPGSNKIVYSGHDGGISKTSNFTTSFGGNVPVVWSSLNNSYHTTQFYSLSLAPESGSNVMMGGLQDNGSWFGNGAGSSNWNFYESGDGTIVEVAPLADDRVYTAYQKGGIRRRTRAGAFQSDFTPTGSFNQSFVNPVALDPNNSSLYYYAAGNASTNSGVWRNSDVINATATTGWTWLGSTGIVPLARVTSIGISTSNNANVVYYGSNAGPIRRIDTANTGASPSVTNIKGTLPNAYVSCIAVDPTNSNNALLVFSNYNTVSLWYTTDGGTNWTDVEGNLAGAGGPSVRWATIFYVDAVPHYFIATSVGVYYTNLLDSSSTVWTQEAVSEIGNVVCVMLDWRNSDKTLAIATHGRGIFTTLIPSALPVELSQFTAKVLRNGGVQLNWRTETEVNNYGFEVERKLSSEQLTVGNWENISFVEGHGNSNSPKEYEFIDDNVLSGKYAYRLKQIDNDGTFEYSKVIEVDIDAPIEYDLSQNYPNPFNPVTIINYSLPLKSQIELVVYNLLGESVIKLVNEEKEAGQHSVEFDATKLSSGIYLISIRAVGLSSDANFTQVKKALLLK